MLRRKSKRSNSGSSPTAPDSSGTQQPQPQNHPQAIMMPPQDSPPRTRSPTRVGPGHLLPLPSTVQRTQSKDEMSVVSDLTGLSDLNSHPNSSSNQQQHLPMSPVHATSLLSSQLDPSQVLSALSSFGGLQASTSFDTGFDTALHVLPEETPSVLRASSSFASGSANHSKSGFGDDGDVNNNNSNITGGPPGNRNGSKGSGNSNPASSSSSQRREEGEESPAWIDFLNDPPSEMTRSRRLALWLMRFQWYYKPKEVLEGDQAECDEAVGASTVFGGRGGGGGGAFVGGVGQLSPTATEAYPFSHSRRETPSLEKAWACTFRVGRCCC